MNRRGFLRGVGAGALYVAVPERVRAYSFLPAGSHLHRWRDVSEWFGDRVQRADWCMGCETVQVITVWPVLHRIECTVALV